jgi:hypothetical protein
MIVGIRDNVFFKLNSVQRKLGPGLVPVFYGLAIPMANGMLNGVNWRLKFISTSLKEILELVEHNKTLLGRIVSFTKRGERIL